MYYQNYEDYMRMVLGYPINGSNTYERNIIKDKAFDEFDKNEINLENYYPEIYKKINPIVNSICSKYTNVSADNLESIVEEVYNYIYNNNRNISGNRLDKQFLKDLIKILVIYNLINRKNKTSNIYKNNTFNNTVRLPFEYYNNYHI